MFSNTVTEVWHPICRCSQKRVASLMDLTWGLRWPQKVIRHLTSGLWEVRVFFSHRYWKAQERGISRCPGLQEILAWWIRIFRIFHEWCVPSREAHRSQTPPQLHHRQSIQSYAAQIWFLSESWECGLWEMVTWVLVLSPPQTRSGPCLQAMQRAVVCHLQTHVRKPQK